MCRGASGSKRVAERGPIHRQAVVADRSAELHAQGPGHGGLGQAGVGAGVLPPVAEQDADGLKRPLAEQRRGQAQQRRRQPRREEVGQVVAAGGRPAEAGVALVAMAEHRIQAC